MIKHPEEYPIEFIKEFEIKIHCFGKNEHRGYDMNGLRRAMNNTDLLITYIYWLEKIAKKYLGSQTNANVKEICAKSTSQPKNRVCNANAKEEAIKQMEKRVGGFEEGEREVAEEAFDNPPKPSLPDTRSKIGEELNKDYVNGHENELNSNGDSK